MPIRGSVLMTMGKATAAAVPVDVPKARNHACICMSCIPSLQVRKI